MSPLLVVAAAVWAQGLDPSLNLHNHTYCSDGADGPKALVEIARKAGVRTLAVTDHDTVDCVAPAIEAGRAAGVRVLAGIELSAEDDSMHILGIGIDPGSPALAPLMAGNRRARLARARETLAKLNTLDAGGRPIRLDLKDVLTRKLNAVRKADGKPPVDSSASDEEALLAQLGPLTRPDIALALVEKGYVPHPGAAFDLYLGDEGEAAADLDGPPFAAAIRAIHEAGGIAILAHPHTIYKFKSKPWTYSGKRYGDFDFLLEDLLAAGLDGIEQYKNNHGPADSIRRYAAGYAARRGRDVLLTPGSDYHGAGGVGQPVLKAIAIPPAIAEKIQAALARTAGGGPSPTPREPALAVEGARVQGIIRHRLGSVEFDRP